MEENLISYVKLCQLPPDYIIYTASENVCIFYFALWMFCVFFTIYSAVPTNLTLYPRFDRELQ